MTAMKIDTLRKFLDSIPAEPGECTYPVYLPKGLYDRAAAIGYDMTNYAPQPMMPTMIEGARLTFTQLAPSNRSKWPCRGDERKHVTDKSCGQELCLPGLGGKCTACADDN